MSKNYILQILPNRSFLTFEKWQDWVFYGTGALDFGYRYRIQLSKKHIWTCYVYDQDQKLFGSAHVNSPDYELLDKRLSKRFYYFKKNKKKA